MAQRFRVDPVSGNIGIYTIPPTGDPDRPLTDPFNNLQYIFFHPGLRYVSIANTITSSITLPAGPGSGFRKQTYSLGAHGQSGRPMLLGKLLGIGPSSTDVAWVGSIPVQQDTTGGPNSIARWVTLGCNSTNLLLYEICHGTSASLGAITLFFTVYVTDRNLDASLPNSGPTKFVVDPAAGRVEFVTPKGSFGTHRRYPKKVSSGGFIFPCGRTVFGNFYGTVGPSILNAVGWTFSHGSGNYQKSSPVYTGGGSPPSYPPPGFASPPVERVNV